MITEENSSVLLEAESLVKVTFDVIKKSLELLEALRQSSERINVSVKEQQENLAKLQHELKNMH